MSILKYFFGGGIPIYFTGKNAVFIGDSITAGASASDAAHRYANLFCAAKSCTLVNMGIGGQVLQNGGGCSEIHPVFDQTTIPVFSGSYAALFIALGVNDIGVNNGIMTAAGFKSTLISVIDYAHNTKGWPFKNIVLLTPFWYTQAGKNLYVGACDVAVAADEDRAIEYNIAVKQTAKLKRCVLVDTHSAMAAVGASLIGGDGIHPINIGHANIANTMINAIYVPY